MPTIVGLQPTEEGVLTQGVKLQMDCVGAYGEASRRLRNKRLAAAYGNLSRTCAKHRDAWQNRLVQLGQPKATPQPSSLWFNIHKVKVASAFGAWAVGRIVANNARDLHTALGRIQAHQRIDAETRRAAATMDSELTAAVALLTGCGSSEQAHKSKAATS